MGVRVSGRVRALFSSVLCLSMFFIQNCFFLNHSFCKCKQTWKKHTNNFVSVSLVLLCLCVLGSRLQHSLAV